MTEIPENQVSEKRIPAYKIIKIIKYVLLPVSIILPIAFGTVWFLAKLPPATTIIDFISSMSILFIELVYLLPPIIIPLILAVVQVSISIFSFLHITQLFLTPKQLKRKPIAIIFRILTVLFGIASIVFVVLFATKTICAYDFLRSVVLFTGGSIVLNVFVE